MGVAGARTGHAHGPSMVPAAGEEPSAGSVIHGRQECDAATSGWVPGMELDAALSFVRSHRNGVLTTLQRNGRPQLSNIVYWVGDDGIIRISATDDRAKSANLRRDARASLHVTSDDFWSYVVIEAQAEVTPVAAAPDDAVVDELVEYYRTLSGEHPDWDDYRRTMVADHRLVLRLRPERAYGMTPR